jgi:undecaprenyl-diphosphatase
MRRVVGTATRTAVRQDWARDVLKDLNVIDRAVYGAVASAPTMRLDPVLARLSAAADRSRLWLACAGILAALGGPRGRRAAVDGIASVAMASTISHAVKWLPRRGRPDRVAVCVPPGRWVRMPTSHSWPSGHSASAFAFASAVGAVIPWLSLPLHLVAAAVAYSRVHTGVHYPGDAVAGVILGTAAATVITNAVRAGRGRCQWMWYKQPTIGGER